MNIVGLIVQPSYMMDVSRFTCENELQYLQLYSFHETDNSTMSQTKKTPIKIEVLISA